jgi:prophage regulatory protein
MLKKMYRIKEVSKLLGIPVSTIWHMVREGTFPAPVKLTPAITAWPEDVLEEWQQCRIEGREWGQADAAAA